MKRIVSLLLCMIISIGGLCAVPASAVDTNVTLRVGLTINGASSFADPKLENVSGEPTGYAIGQMQGTTFTGSTTVSSSQLTIQLVNDAFQVSDTATGKVLYTSAQGADHLAIRPNSALTWFKGYKWYGNFVYRRASGNNLTVINYVGLEDYVKGVLPYEISASWPAEAQKAQAVCARSFALGTHKHTSEGYDLCNTTNCQVYLGANLATAASDAAVEATRGEYLSYNGELVIGYFFSSDGGATEDAVNVWGGDYPYLQGKVDPYETYDSSWSVTLTANEVRQKLLNAGYSIGTVANVEVTKRTDTDNVNEVTVTDTDGKTVTIQRDKVRTVFGLNSIRYTITPNAAKSVSASLPQSASLKISPSTHKVTLDGKAVAPQGYNIQDNNYYKLRDIAYILNGTDSQFNVTWDSENNRILLESGKAYQSVGGEMTGSVSSQIKNCIPSSSSIVLDGKTVSLTGYLVNDNNYYKLRDVGAALGFDVDYDDANKTVLISSGSSASTDPEGPSTPDTTVPPVSYTFTGSGWGHSVGMSQWGAYAMAQQGFSYEEILKFYYTGISIAG
ncbi:SpoIID/LytB domain-containing protein [Agathobaculum sp. Marseille-P7918]|uniref:SpoIID/LytB domain-containing protein n=1 Tax=Agathobaculum sp. Marseille-P7918 TaxID=2479843 RepID=UPI000F6355C8|nr:SpoIID/LytB domain-containing protein [Agathobaculum sp. Marseille-P7918]